MLSRVPSPVVRITAPVVWLAVTASVIAAGCGGSDSSSPDTTLQTTPAESSSDEPITADSSAAGTNADEPNAEEATSAEPAEPARDGPSAVVVIDGVRYTSTGGTWIGTTSTGLYQGAGTGDDGTIAYLLVETGEAASITVRVGVDTLYASSPDHPDWTSSAGYGTVETSVTDGVASGSGQVVDSNTTTSNEPVYADATLESLICG